MNKAELDKTFSPARTALLLRNRLVEELNVVGIAFGIVFCLGILGILGSNAFDVSLGDHQSGSQLYGPLIFVFGLWLASRSFAPMHGSGAPDWLLLPATGSEKFAAGALWIIVLWPLLASAGATAMSALLSALSFLLGRGWRPVWHPFTSGGLSLLLAWLSVTPVFLAGSTFFKKSALLRTAGVIAASFTAAGIVISIILYFFFAGRGGFHFDGSTFSLDGDPVRSRAFQIICDAWRYGVLPVSALVFAWFRVREKEASDAVQ